MKLWVLLFVVTLKSASGQQEDDYPHFYNLPKSLAKFAEALNSPRDLRRGLSDLAPIIVNQYSDFLSGRSEDRILEYSAVNNNGSSRCNQDVLYLNQNLGSKDMWGWKMLDAFGKPSSGILEGNVKWIGSYHECTKIYVPQNATDGGFHAQYCSLELSVEASQKAIPLTLGICVPESCSSEPLEHFQDAFSALSQFGFNVNVTQKTCQPVSKKLTDAAVTVIVLISFFVIIALIGSSITVFEYFWKRESDIRSSGNSQTYRAGDTEMHLDISSTVPKTDENNRIRDIKEFFKCFCVLSNGEKLLNTDSTEGQMLCLNGIRFLSMAWVILSHVYSVTILYVGNVMEAIEAVDGFLFQIILNGVYSVDSFFLLSGFLMAYLYFQQVAKKKGKIPWLYFYIHRYVRLTPVYMVVLLFHTSLSYYTGSGPFWTLNEVDPVCPGNYWYNLLYINNFAPDANRCMPWTWYLANDMQFFVVSPLILITLWRWPPIGYSILGIFMSATVAANFGITSHYGLKSGYGIISPDSEGLKQFTNADTTFLSKIYTKPYTRMSPYLVGIILAYYIFKRKHSNQGKLNWTALSIGWIVASVSSLFSVFCLYHSILSVVLSGFYNAFSHALFTGGIGWVIFTCLNGQAGPINSILSFKLFIPLSRLTYCAYLIHPIVIIAYFGSLEVPFQFSHLTVVTLYLGLLVITYSLAFVVSVLFESPVIRLDKLIRTKFTS